MFAENARKKQLRKEAREAMVTGGEVPGSSPEPAEEPAEPDEVVELGDLEPEDPEVEPEEE